MKKLLLITALLFSISAQADCGDNFQNGSVPSAPSASKTLCHKGYTVVYNLECKVPYVVGELLSPVGIGTFERSNKFKPDPLLSYSESAQLSDYSGDHDGKTFDRGHLAPAEDFSANSVEMDESFYLSNMAPQLPGNNRGPWRSVEMRTRAYSIKYGKVYVVTGLLFESDERIGSSKVCVPSHYFKVVKDTSGNVLESFLVSNTEIVRGSAKSFSIDVKELEKRSKIKLH